LHSLGFVQSKTDASLFVLKRKEAMIYVLVYVDNIIVCSSTVEAGDKLLKELPLSFAVKDPGNLCYFLGIEATIQKNGLLLIQQKYIGDLLLKANMVSYNPAATPMANTKKLSREEGTLLSEKDSTQYRSLVGALQYVTLTRPDIAFAVNKVCQFLHSPTNVHLMAAKHILRYLKGTNSIVLMLSRSGSQLMSAFSDADWVVSPDDRRSTGGFVIFYRPNLISWSSKKQPTVAKSSTKSEYKALANAIVELIWIQSLLKELGAFQSWAPVLRCDNIRAVYLTANPVFLGRTKHVEVDFHFIRERVAEKALVVRIISSEYQLADIFTKALGRQEFHRLLHNLNLK
jgi:hypothetical protein